MASNCQQCDCVVEWNRIEYVERELIPTADGGDYVRLLLPFCCREHLLLYLQEPTDDES